MEMYNVPFNLYTVHNSNEDIGCEYYKIYMCKDLLFYPNMIVP